MGAGHGNHVIHSVAIGMNSEHAKRVVSGELFLGESRRRANQQRDQYFPHAPD